LQPSIGVRISSYILRRDSKNNWFILEFVVVVVFVYFSTHKYKNLDLFFSSLVRWIHFLFLGVLIFTNSPLEF
jgi:hypothetical protein